jgi:hypothetical protein
MKLSNAMWTLPTMRRPGSLRSPGSLGALACTGARLRAGIAWTTYSTRATEFPLGFVRWTLAMSSE